MKLYTLVILLTLLLLVGCVSVQKIETNAYDVTTQARVRAIKGALIRFYPNQECSSPTLLGIGDKGYSATGGVFSVLESNKTIGMPLLKDTPHTFNEHVVPANKSLTIEALFSQKLGDMQYTCGPVIGTFIPSPGKDYEVALVYVGRGCNLNIREISSVGVEEKPIPINFKSSLRCRG
jgi:hypothetical protein